MPNIDRVKGRAVRTIQDCGGRFETWCTLCDTQLHWFDGFTEGRRSHNKECILYEKKG